MRARGDGDRKRRAGLHRRSRCDQHEAKVVAERIQRFEVVGRRNDCDLGLQWRSDAARLTHILELFLHKRANRDDPVPFGEERRGVGNIRQSGLPDMHEDCGIVPMNDFPRFLGGE